MHYAAKAGSKVGGGGQKYAEGGWVYKAFFKMILEA